MRADSLTLIGAAFSKLHSTVCVREADALHLFLAIGHLVNVAHCEGRPPRYPDREGLAVFAAANPLLILAGHDESDDRIADALARDFGGPSCRLFLPDDCESVADLRRRGEVLSWLSSEWTRLGSPWSTGLLEHYEAEMMAVEGARYHA